MIIIFRIIAFTSKFCENIEKNLDLSVNCKTDVLEKCQHPSYIFCTPTCRESNSNTHGIMSYCYMTIVKAL